MVVTQTDFMSIRSALAGFLSVEKPAVIREEHSGKMARALVRKQEKDRQAKLNRSGRV